MNEIEQEMLQALRDGEDFAQGNTAIRHVRKDKAVVLVNDKPVAHVEGTFSGEHTLRVQRRVLREHPSEAACSRLRALGVAATYVAKGKKVLINNEPA